MFGRISSFILFAFLALSLSANAAFQVPKGLSQIDRRKVTEVLGLSTSMKVLSDPYPLGGYAGVEVGLGFEVIGIKDISTLGGANASQNETNYSLVSLGKGLYNNFDIMFQFSPFTQTEDVSSVGGQIRWGFFKAAYLPLNMSFMSSINSVNFSDKVSMLSQGNDLVAGFSVKDITLYMGVGVVRTIATFQGGMTCTRGNTTLPADPLTNPQTCTKNSESTTDTGDTLKEDVSQSHYLAGVNLKMDQAFLAMQMDRYTQSVFSAKLGMRF